MRSIEPWLQTTQLLKMSLVLKFVLLKSLIPTTEKVESVGLGGRGKGKKKEEKEREKGKQTIAFQDHVLISFYWASHFFIKIILERLMGEETIFFHR